MAAESNLVAHDFQIDTEGRLCSQLVWDSSSKEKKDCHS